MAGVTGRLVRWLGPMKSEVKGVDACLRGYVSNHRKNRNVVHLYTSIICNVFTGAFESQ